LKKLAPRAGFEPATNRLTEVSRRYCLQRDAAACRAQASASAQDSSKLSSRIIAGYCT
jgi:hypothetical protein